jgi:hypothetical protein
MGHHARSLGEIWLAEEVPGVDSRAKEVPGEDSRAEEVPGENSRAREDAVAHTKLVDLIRTQC